MFIGMENVVVYEVDLFVYVNDWLCGLNWL